MEKIIDRLEAVTEEEIEKFQKDPLKQGVKFLIFVWIFKTIWTWIKK